MKILVIGPKDASSSLVEACNLKSAGHETQLISGETGFSELVRYILYLTLKDIEAIVFYQETFVDADTEKVLRKLRESFPAPGFILLVSQREGALSEDLVHEWGASYWFKNLAYVNMGEKIEKVLWEQVVKKPRQKNPPPTNAPVLVEKVVYRNDSTATKTPLPAPLKTPSIRKPSYLDRMTRKLHSDPGSNSQMESNQKTEALPPGWLEARKGVSGRALPSLAQAPAQFTIPGLPSGPSSVKTIKTPRGRPMNIHGETIFFSPQEYRVLKALVGNPEEQRNEVLMQVVGLRTLQELHALIRRAQAKLEKRKGGMGSIIQRIGEVSYKYISPQER